MLKKSAKQIKRFITFSKDKSNLMLKMFPLIRKILLKSFYVY